LANSCDDRWHSHSLIHPYRGLVVVIDGQSESPGHEGGGGGLGVLGVGDRVGG